MPSKKLTPETEEKEKAFNLRLPADVYAMLQALAKAETRSLNSMVIELIKRASKS